MAWATRILALTLAALLGACAHPVSITPNLGSLPPGEPAVQQNVAYVVSEANRDLEVTTPGGGGDSVRYFPYRELESGLFQALSGIYSRVTLLRATPDAAQMSKGNFTLVFLPTITTSSSSTSIMTWPPTDFSVTIGYTVQDAGGLPLYKGSVVGTGQADFATFKSDFGIAGKRAAEDALRKFRAQVLASPVGAGGAAPRAPAGPVNVDDLKDLLPPR